MVKGQYKTEGSQLLPNHWNAVGDSVAGSPREKSTGKNHTTIGEEDEAIAAANAAASAAAAAV